MNGQKIATGIGGWIVVKGVLNLILSGFGLNNIIELAVGAVFAFLLTQGTKYMNYVVAVLLAVIAIKNLKPNIDGFSNGTAVYLIEGIVDIICAVVLVFNKDVRSHFE